MFIVINCFCRSKDYLVSFKIKYYEVYPMIVENYVKDLTPNIVGCCSFNKESINLAVRLKLDQRTKDYYGFTI